MTSTNSNDQIPPPTADLDSIACKVQAEAAHEADFHGVRVTTIVLAPDGGFRIRAGGINVTEMLGLLHRTLRAYEKHCDDRALIFEQRKASAPLTGAGGGGAASTGHETIYGGGAASTGHETIYAGDPPNWSRVEAGGGRAVTSEPGSLRISIAQTGGAGTVSDWWLATRRELDEVLRIFGMTTQQRRAFIEQFCTREQDNARQALAVLREHARAYASEGAAARKVNEP